MFSVLHGGVCTQYFSVCECFDHLCRNKQIDIEWGKHRHD